MVLLQVLAKFARSFRSAATSAPHRISHATMMWQSPPQFNDVTASRIRRTLTFLRQLHRGQTQRRRQERVRQIFSRIFRWFVVGNARRRPSLKQQHLLGFTAIASSAVSSSTSAPHPSPQRPTGTIKPKFDWDAARIQDALMVAHKNDLDYVTMLTEKTLTCKHCRKRLVIDDKVQGVDYCSCAAAKPAVYGQQTEGVEWTPFLERKDILVWRQEHPAGSGMYAYKMYGHFSDVTPNEFIEVQLDMSAYRLDWDKSTAQCHVIEQEETLPKDDSGRSLSQIYYWEVNWPRFFANRDYVANRRALVFGNGKSDRVAVVYTKSTVHPNAPKKSKNFRVEEYWSVMTVKPTKGWDEPGLEFSLTCFENPGLSLPTSITTWVAIRGMPEFMNNLRKACIELREWSRKETRQGGRPIKRYSDSEPSYMSTERKVTGSEDSEEKCEGQTIFRSNRKLSQ